MRCQRRPAADPRSYLPGRARSLFANNLGPDGARALAPALEKMADLEKLKCVANAAQQPSPAQTSPASSDPPRCSIEYNDIGDGLAAIEAAVSEACRVES